MVVICLPAASLTSTPQERIATPSIWTVQAPHCAMPQPYLVPVRPIFSRIAHSSGVSGSTSTSKALPLIVRFAIVGPLDGLPRPWGDVWTENRSGSNQEYSFAERNNLICQGHVAPAPTFCYLSDRGTIN